MTAGAIRDRLELAPEVADALGRGRAVVALESTLISHGLPYPQNVEVARASEAAVRASGAVPATVAVRDGRFLVGLADADLEALADVQLEWRPAEVAGGHPVPGQRRAPEGVRGRLAGGPALEPGCQELVMTLAEHRVCLGLVEPRAMVALDKTSVKVNRS